MRIVTEYVTKHANDKPEDKPEVEPTLKALEETAETLGKQMPCSATTVILVKSTALAAIGTS